MNIHFEEKFHNNEVVLKRSTANLDIPSFVVVRVINVHSVDLEKTGKVRTIRYEIEYIGSEMKNTVVEQDDLLSLEINDEPAYDLKLKLQRMGSKK